MFKVLFIFPVALTCAFTIVSLAGCSNGENSQDISTETIENVKSDTLEENEQLGVEQSEEEYWASKGFSKAVAITRFKLSQNLNKEVTSDKAFVKSHWQILIEAEQTSDAYVMNDFTQVKSVNIEDYQEDFSPIIIHEGPVVSTLNYTVDYKANAEGADRHLQLQAKGEVDSIQVAKICPSAVGEGYELEFKFNWVATVTGSNIMAWADISERYNQEVGGFSIINLYPDLYSKPQKTSHPTLQLVHEDLYNLIKREKSSEVYLLSGIRSGLETVVTDNNQLVLSYAHSGGKQGRFLGFADIEMMADFGNDFLENQFELEITITKVD